MYWFGGTSKMEVRCTPSHLHAIYQDHRLIVLGTRKQLSVSEKFATLTVREMCAYWAYAN